MFSRLPAPQRLAGLVGLIALVGAAYVWWDWLQPFAALVAGPALLVLGAGALVVTQWGRLHPLFIACAVASLLAPAVLYVFVALTAHLTMTPSSPLYQAFFLLQVALYLGAIVGCAIARRWLAVAVLVLALPLVAIMYFVAVFAATCGLFSGGPCP
jgi:hypothetical protein